MTQYGDGSVLEAIPALKCVGGKTLVDRRGLRQRPFFLSHTAKAISANGDGLILLTPPRDRGEEGDADLSVLTAESTGRFSVQLYLDSIDRQLSNQPVESSLIFGHGSLPGLLGESLWITAQSSLKATVADLSGAANTIQLCAGGTQYLAERTPEEKARISHKPWRHAFWLTTNDGAEVTVGANSTASYRATVPGDAYMQVWGVVARSDGAFSWEWIEGERRTLMSVSGVIPAALSLGQTLSVTGFPGSQVPASGMGYYLPKPCTFAKNTDFKFRLTDTSGSSNKISIALVGQLLYYPLG